ncbi:uncharacterized protein LOC126660847 isoform X2 [Mercurialis annua]|uniref:uncharacterized protein LOC126660847 isoform X2 n=1 Tax=Mercurialis annua TaxID=3986 RepID=UPI002160C183|nr:uncharacterized protein LOC126660847 isoform X2 [Mercurialis annua]
MANQSAASGSSSSPQPLEQGFEDDESMMVYGSEPGWVEAKTSCDHLGGSLCGDLTHIPGPDTPCHSRFVNKHMLQHYHETTHCVALSYSDLSVWCFACDAYLDAQVIMQLRPVYETAYILKFGEAPPFRAVELTQDGTSSST